MKLETRIRNRRRAATLRVERPRIERRFDELRAALSVTLEDYESLVDEALQSVPELPDLERAALADLYYVSGVGPTPTMMGPRVVATVAAMVEEFCTTWLADVDLDDVRREAAADAFAAERETVEAELDRVLATSRKHATEAERALGEVLDAALLALEEERSSREEDRLQGADLEKARKREAARWEAQRARAEELRGAWEVLEPLVFEGIDAVARGIGDLEEMLGETVAVVLRAYPEFEETKPVRGSRVRNFAVPPPLPPRRDERGSPSFVIDEPQRSTEPMNAYSTEEYTREVNQTPLPEGPDSEAEGERVAAFEAPSAATIELPTAADTVETVVVEATTPMREAALPTRDATAAPVPPEPAPIPKGRLVGFESRDTIVFDEPSWRIRAGWRPVRATEIVAVLAAPVLVLFFELVWVVAFLVGLVANNPVNEYPVVLPLFFGFAALAIVVPLILGWRFRWDAGWVPRIQRWQRTRDHTTLRVGRHDLRMDDVVIDWHETTPSLAQTATSPARWILALTDEQGREHVFNAEASYRAPEVERLRDRLDGWNIAETTLMELWSRAGG